MTIPHRVQFLTLGTGTVLCSVCHVARTRIPAETAEEETRLRYAELGFRNGALRTAEGLDEMARHALERAEALQVEAGAYRSAAAHARLIARGRAPDD